MTQFGGEVSPTSPTSSFQLPEQLVPPESTDPFGDWFWGSLGGAFEGIGSLLGINPPDMNLAEQTPYTEEGIRDLVNRIESVNGFERGYIPREALNRAIKRNVEGDPSGFVEIEGWLAGAIPQVESYQSQTNALQGLLTDPGFLDMIEQATRLSTKGAWDEDIARETAQVGAAINLQGTQGREAERTSAMSRGVGVGGTSDAVQEAAYKANKLMGDISTNIKGNYQTLQGDWAKYLSGLKGTEFGIREKIGALGTAGPGGPLMPAFDVGTFQQMLEQRPNEEQYTDWFNQMADFMAPTLGDQIMGDVGEGLGMFDAASGIFGNLFGKGQSSKKKEEDKGGMGDFGLGFLVGS